MRNCVVCGKKNQNKKGDNIMYKAIVEECIIFLKDTYEVRQRNLKFLGIELVCLYGREIGIRLFPRKAS